MTTEREDQTISKTQWTGLLVEDLFAALKNGRGDDTVRGFANELIGVKDLPVGYLVRKVSAEVGAAEATRLDLLMRGSYAVKQDAAAQSVKAGGLLQRLKSRLGLGR